MDEEEVRPIHIAVFLDPEEADRLGGLLASFRSHFSPVQLVLFGEGAAPEADLPVRPLADFDPERFDLVLDCKEMAGGLPSLAAPASGKLVTGAASQVMEGILLELSELLKQQEISNGILDSNTDAIVTINEDHSIVGYNRGAEKIFGYSKAEALGQDLKILIPPPYKEAHRDYVRRYLATREARMIGKHVQLNAQRRDGSEFPISISFSVADIRGALFFTGIVRDITEYKQMEDRLLKAERLAAVGNTVSHMAHEIKNPLAIIGGFARQLLKVTGPLDAKSQQKLQIITEEVSRLEGMIAEMRDFVKWPQAQRRPGQIEDLLNEVLDLFQDTLGEQKIKVKLLKEGPLPLVSFDPQQMHQVLINLVKNALEAMPRGGELTIGTQVKGKNIEVRIADTGQGMSPEIKKSIFQPYFTTKEKGTGLGLAICQNIVEEHGGCILADSSPGRGSTFTIQIPLEEAAG